ncbi:hypothetical protein CJP72_24085 [Citrobacter sp. NCU1]|uniref:DUF4062 domain-containing protein n=1 Tax=Citrobacter sp. NCU1 TaxID=2026683 RepID=UPI0013920963|nr:hypothetical protein [Citrobacter sp. NCU1]
MDKRYQVFVSSTFTDLKEERSNVIQSLMEMDCIPAGMELFPSIDEEQWEFIKKIIDDSDYYLLIIGGRYGTVAEDGLSFTEKEFDYALSRGLKVVVLVHEDPNSLPLSKSEKDPELREKLQQFIEKASTGRLRKTWSSAKELSGLVALSLNKTIKAYPAIGWVRADKVSSEDTLHELNELRKKNEELSEKIRNLENRSDYTQPQNLATLDEIYELSYEISTFGWGHSETSEEKKTLQIKWSELFSIISPFLINESIDNDVYDILKDHIEKVAPHAYEHTAIDLQELKTIYLQFKALDLLDHSNPNWKLSSKGIDLMMQLRTIKNKS